MGVTFFRIKKDWIVIGLLFLIVFSCKENNSLPAKMEGKEIKVKTDLFQFLSDSISGVSFINKLQESFEMNALNYDYMYNGAGVSAGDFNNDGLVDLYFISNQASNKLFLNMGQLKFEDVTDTANVQGFPGFELASTIVDINSDGLLDIYVCRSGPFIQSQARENKLYVNLGNNSDGVPVFEEQGKKYQLNLPHYSTQASFFDFDKDGDLDMFLINHNTDTKVLYNLDELKEIKSPLTSDRLFRNDENKFVDVSNEAGIISDGIGFGLGVSIGDLNNDTWPDVLVAQDFSSTDRIYLNQKNGKFKEVSKIATKHISNFSMGNDIADYNNDGWLDFMTLDMVSEDNYGIKSSMSGMNPRRFSELLDKGFYYQYMYNTLQVNNGTNAETDVPVFSDVASLSGVSSTDWSWGPLFLDMDNDGDKDLFISNGIKKDFRNVDFIHYRQNVEAEFEKKISEAPISVKHLLERQRDEIILRRMPTRKKNNYFYENKGDLTFNKRNDEWSLEKLSASNGATYADLDNDGDLEIITNNMDDKAFIYKNNSIENDSGNFLKINLIGSEKNLNGLGTRVTIETQDGIQNLEKYFTRGFQSSTSDKLHFGLGKLKAINKLSVLWPDNNVQYLYNIKCNQEITLKHSNAIPSDDFSVTKKEQHLFKDITDERGLNHYTYQNSFNDFERESLLPHKMSEDKLGLCVGDVNGDGLEDFFVGGAVGYPGALFVQNTEGGFNKTNIVIFNNDKEHEDVDAIFLDVDNDGDLDLFVVSGGNEFEVNSSQYADRLYINNALGVFSKNTTALPSGLNFSGSVVRPNDIDGDGDLDLFVGGRQTPGQYPYSGTSLLLKNESNKISPKFSLLENKELKNLGMVTDAKWVDADKDGIEELVLAGEWMPITIFKNKNGKLTKDTAQSELNKSVGWWFSLEPGDFDGDGDIDFVAGNLGLNSKYRASFDAPFQVFAKDFDNTGTFDIVLGYNQNGISYPLRGRECSSQQMPFIKKKFPSYHEFALADIETVYGKENLESALSIKATNFSTSYLENQGNGIFMISSLKNIAQTTTIKSIISHDVNGDGNLDLFLLGNLYGFEVETPRQDAGYGLYLEGNKGKFKKNENKRFFVDGEVVNSKIIKLIKDGIALVILRNNDKLQLIKIK